MSSRFPNGVEANIVADPESIGTSELANLAVTTAKIADGNVTGAKLSTPANTRVVAVAIGGVADSGEDNHIFVAPSACTITDVRLVSDTATTSSDGSNNYTFQVVNKTQTENLLASAVSTNSNEIAADTSFAITPDQNATIADGDVLELTIAENGTATDLSSAKVTIFVEYTVAA